MHGETVKKILVLALCCALYVEYMLVLTSHFQCCPQWCDGPCDNQDMRFCLPFLGICGCGVVLQTLEIWKTDMCDNLLVNPFVVTVVTVHCGSVSSILNCNASSCQRSAGLHFPRLKGSQHEPSDLSSPRDLVKNRKLCHV